LTTASRRFPFINAVVDESLRVRSSQSTERVSAGQLCQIGVAGKLSSTTALINEMKTTPRGCYQDQLSSYKHLFNNLINFTV